MPKSASHHILHIYESHQLWEVSGNDLLLYFRDSGSKRAQRPCHLPLCVATQQRVLACPVTFEAIGHGVVSSSGVAPGHIVGKGRSSGLTL